MGNEKTIPCIVRKAQSGKKKKIENVCLGGKSENEESN